MNPRRTKKSSQVITRTARLARTLGVGLLAALAITPAAGATPERPSFVILLADNLGYGDLACYGNRAMHTPRIDQLAAEGVRCTDFYVVSSSCSPSRAALLTGRYPLHNGLQHQLSAEENRAGIGLPHPERLLPEYLKPLGYATACIGKWNLGFAPGSRPTERGFDTFFGHASGNIDYYDHTYRGQNDLFEGTEPVRRAGYSTDLFADAACAFLRRHAGRPFLLYLAFNAVHYVNLPDGRTTWQAPEASFRLHGADPATTDMALRYRAAVSALDAGVGQVLDQLRALGLDDETVVVFFSDNGAFLLPGRGLGVASNAPLRDGGTTTYEGGVRVPCVVRYPPRIPAGSLCREPLSHLDLLPLFLALAGGELPRDRVLDGRDPLPTLMGQAPSPHEYLFFQFRHGNGLRAGRFKLVQPGPDRPWELYDLERDRAETCDLAAAQPDTVERLRRAFIAWQAEARRGR